VIFLKKYLIKKAEVSDNAINTALRNFIKKHSYDLKQHLKDIIKNEFPNTSSEEIAHSRYVVDFINDYVLNNEDDYIDELANLIKDDNLTYYDAKSEAQDSLYSDNLPVFTNIDAVISLIKELKGE
jgi:hypothetical protein